MKILEEVIEVLQDMADVADTVGSAYLYRRNTPRIREMIDKLKILSNDFTTDSKNVL